MNCEFICFVLGRIVYLSLRKINKNVSNFLKLVIYFIGLYSFFCRYDFNYVKVLDFKVFVDLVFL